jgi:hypothetical protein
LRCRRAAREPLRLETDLSVGADRRVAIHRDDGDDLLGVHGIEPKIGDLTDANAVEQNGGAYQQA